MALARLPSSTLVASHPFVTQSVAPPSPPRSARFPPPRASRPGGGEGAGRGPAVVHGGGVQKWRVGVSFFPFPSFLSSKKGKSTEEIKEELLEAIAPLDRGADATEEDRQRVDQIARELEAANSIKEPLESTLLNGKWELIYTTSRSILATQRPKILRPNGKIYQAINVDTLRAQNMETWPFFNQVTANLVPINARRVAVKFDTFKILGLIPIKAPGRGRGELEITYLDEEIRILQENFVDFLQDALKSLSSEALVSRGDKGNVFILKMVDPSYRVPA